MTPSIYTVTFRLRDGAYQVRVWAATDAQARARARVAFALQPWVPPLPMDADLEVTPPSATD